MTETTEGPRTPSEGVASVAQGSNQGRRGGVRRPIEGRRFDSVIVWPMAGVDLDRIAEFAAERGAIERHRIRSLNVTSFDLPWHRRYEIAFELATHRDVRRLETNHLVGIGSADTPPPPVTDPAGPTSVGETAPFDLPTTAVGGLSGKWVVDAHGFALTRVLDPRAAHYIANAINSRARTAGGTP